MPSVSVSPQDLQARLASGGLAGAWTLDAARSSVTFTTRAMFGLAGVQGTFTDVSGNAQVSEAGAVSGQLVITAASIDTRMKKRDAHLRSADFFHVESFPSLTFTAEGVTAGSDPVTVAGSLTVRGVTKPVSVRGAIVSLGDHEVVLEGTTDIDRSEFGLQFRKMGARDMVNHVTVRAVFTRG